jgi:hypothetical protein
MGINVLPKVFAGIFFSVFLMACFNEEKFDKKHDIPPSHSRTTNKYTEEQFFDNTSLYQKGKNEISIGAGQYIDTHIDDSYET